MQALYQTRIVFIDLQAHDVHGLAGPGDGNFHAGHEAHAQVQRGRARGGDAGHFIVVRQRPYIDARLARVRSHGSGREHAVGNIRMTMQVDFKHVKTIPCTGSAWKKFSLYAACPIRKSR